MLYRLARLAQWGLIVGGFALSFDQVSAIPPGGSASPFVQWWLSSLTRFGLFVAGIVLIVLGARIGAWADGFRGDAPWPHARPR